MSVKSFAEKLAIITGAGSGIGQALALQLGKKGCHLALVDVNRKGLQATKRLLADCEVNVTQHVVDVSNATAMEKLADDVVVKHGNAHIINLASMVAFVAPPEQTSYSATKSAIKGFSESLWAELHGNGVGVTVVHPGAIKTNIMQEAMKTAEHKVAFAKTQSMVDKFAMPVEKAAKMILKAVKQGKMRVIVGVDALLLEGAKRALPDHANKLFLLQAS